MVAPIVISHNGGYLAVVVSPRHCCMVATTWTAEGGRATGIAQEAIEGNSGCAPFFVYGGGGEAGCKSVLRVALIVISWDRGTLLLLSFPNCVVVVLCSSFCLDGRGRESGCRIALMVAPIVISCNGGHVAVVVSPRHCCTAATT
jgi:hypothetical protein